MSSSLFCLSQMLSHRTLLSCIPFNSKRISNILLGKVQQNVQLINLETCMEYHVYVNFSVAWMLVSWEMCMINEIEYNLFSHMQNVLGLTFYFMHLPNIRPWKSIWSQVGHIADSHICFWMEHSISHCFIGGFESSNRLPVKLSMFSNRVKLICYIADLLCHVSINYCLLQCGLVWFSFDMACTKMVCLSSQSTFLITTQMETVL